MVFDQFIKGVEEYFGYNSAKENCSFVSWRESRSELFRSNWQALCSMLRSQVLFVVQIRDDYCGSGIDYESLLFQL